MYYSCGDRQSSDLQSGSSVSTTPQQVVAAAEAAKKASQSGSSVAVSPEDRARVARATE
jgi:hypothetical protein